jgi:predicted transcriptional regulator
MAEATHKGVSHTIRLTLLRRLERIAYHTKISRSAILEHAVDMMFKVHPKDTTLIASLQSAGASRRRPHYD